MSKNLDNNVMTSDDEDIDADLKPGFLLPANSEEKEFKYIGLMAWHRRLCRQTISMQQLEGILLDTLLLEPLFICLRQSILKKLKLPLDYTIYLEIKISTLKEVLKSREFYDSSPKNLNGRNLPDNISLLETVLCITKLNLLKPQEIKSIIIAFDLLSKHNLNSEIFIQSEMHIEALQESLRFINRAISPKLVVDWCLRCHLFLDFSRSFNNPNRSKNPLQTKRFVMQKCKLQPHEFLSLMCNSVERQQMLLKAHNPNFSGKKIKISEDSETTKGEFRSQIYALDLDKKNFVEKRPTEVIIEQLNETFHAALHPAQKKNHEFRNYYGLIAPHPQFIKDASGLPILEKNKNTKFSLNLQAVTVKKLENSFFDQNQNPVELQQNFNEVDLAEAVAQASRSLNKIAKINNFAQGQQTQQPQRTSTANSTSHTRFSNLGQKLSQGLVSGTLTERTQTAELKMRKRSRVQIMTEAKSIPYFNKDNSGQKSQTISFISPSNRGLQRNVEAVRNRRNVQQFQGTGPGQLALRLQRALDDQQAQLELRRTLDMQEDTRQEFYKIKMNLLSDLREAQKPVYLRKSGIRKIQRQMIRRIEEREEKRSSFDTIRSGHTKKGLVEILSKRGLQIQKRTKTIAEQEKEELYKSKPKIQSLIESQSQFNQTLFSNEITNLKQSIGISSTVKIKTHLHYRNQLDDHNNTTR